MPISVLVWMRSFIEPDVLKKTVRQYRSDLSDQSVLEIRVRIMVRLSLRVALF